MRQFLAMLAWPITRVDDGIIAVNPALELGRRKASRADKLNAAGRLQRVRPMSGDQRDAFLEAAAKERPYAAPCSRCSPRPDCAPARPPPSSRATLISASAHTYASSLLALGAPITYVSAQLGHSNASATLRYYARWIPSKGRRWAVLLNRLTDFL